MKVRKIIEANPDVYQAQKQRLRENKRKQIEAIDNQARARKEQIRNQYRSKIDAINRVQGR